MWPFNKTVQPNKQKIETVKSLTLIELNVVSYYEMTEGLLNTIEKNLKPDGHYQEGLAKIKKGHETNELILRQIVDQIEAIKGRR